MLAGRIKQKTFLIIAGVVGLGAIVGLYYACDSGSDAPSKPAVAGEPKKATAQPAPKPGPAAPAPTPAVDGPSERPVDQAIMRFVGKNLGSDKKKDVTSGQPYKVNVYQDAGNATANRAKVDLDRDEKWDEKWTFKDGEISRKTSSNDDDNYDKEEVWQGGEWVAR